METLIQEIRKSRQKSGMTQAVLAEKIGIPQSHLSSIEQGKTDVRLSTLIQIARLLNHEIMLVPRQLETLVSGLLEGKVDLENEPRFQLDNEEG